MRSLPLLILLIQAVAGPQLPAAPRPRSDKPCPLVVTADVVVCGREDDRFRLPRLPDQKERDGLGRAETSIGPARIAAEAEQVALPGGQQSKRLMMRLKLPIGQRPARSTR